MVAVQEHLKAWRKENPCASLRQIEEEVERWLAQLRFEMVRDLALSSEATDGRVDGERVTYPQCGGKMVRHGYRERHLRDEHDQDVTLQHAYCTCTECGHGFFPFGPRA